MSNINKDELLRFIAKAHRNTYAASKEVGKKQRLEVPFLPGHKCYYFRDGDFEYYDGYAGKAWAPGREVILLGGKPIWAMSYQGRHNENYSEQFFEEEVFPFLKRALMAITDEMPFRGPSILSEGDFEYTFRIEGDYQYFKGRETITHKGEVVFFQDVMGELIK